VRGFRDAKESFQAQDEVEDSPRREKAFQGHRHGQNSSHAFREAPFARHQETRPDAQAKEAHIGEPRGQAEREALASVRLGRIAGKDFQPQSIEADAVATKSRAQARAILLKSEMASRQAALHGCLPADNEPQQLFASR